MARAPKKPPEKASTAEGGAPFLLSKALAVFDRGNGDAVDWAALGGAALLVVLHAIDKAPADPRMLALVRRMETVAYEHIAAGPGGRTALPQPAAQSTTSTASPVRPLPPPHPRGIGGG